VIFARVAQLARAVGLQAVKKATDAFAAHSRRGGLLFDRNYCSMFTT
jgi:hypothetical protein